MNSFLLPAARGFYWPVTVEGRAKEITVNSSEQKKGYFPQQKF
jgi:hypothetical protein